MASLDKCREGGSSDTEEEQPTSTPPGIETPVSDGLPQVREGGVGFLLFFWYFSSSWEFFLLSILVLCVQSFSIFSFSPSLEFSEP